MSESEYLCDLYMGDEILEEGLEEQRSDLKELREERKIKLIGKYLVVCDGIKSKKLCYLQDQRISSKGYWTNYMSNAIGFTNRNEAIRELKKLRYNNPRIVLVTSDFKLMKIKI